MTLLTVVDIETLGMAPPAAVIEMAWHTVRYAPDGLAETGETSDDSLFGIPDGQIMSSDNRAVHHIDPTSLAGIPLFSLEASTSLVGEDYLVAHNAEFEQAFLPELQAPWICTYKVALRLLPDAPSHSNQALKYELAIPDAPEHHPPHRALPDTIVTSLVLLELVRIAMDRAPELSLRQTLDRMVEISTEPRLLPRCPIGKFRGSPWSEVDSGFLSWMLRQPDMAPDLVWNANRELTRRRRGDPPQSRRD